MSAQETLLMLRAAGGEPDDQARQAVSDLVDRTTEAERAAVVTTLRRGASWDEAVGWLEQVRRDAGALDDDAFQRALALYGSSVLLDWKECLDVAPAMTYRSEGLPENA